MRKGSSVSGRLRIKDMDSYGVACEGGNAIWTLRSDLQLRRSERAVALVGQRKRG